MALPADNSVNRKDGAEKYMNIKFHIGSLFRFLQSELYFAPAPKKETALQSDELKIQSFLQALHRTLKEKRLRA